MSMTLQNGAPFHIGAAVNNERAAFENRRVNGAAGYNRIGAAGNTGGNVSSKAGGGFAEALKAAARQNAASELKISKHAETRLNERNIKLTESQRCRIADALDKAGQKGVKDALVMLDGLAVVANAKSKAVITAVAENDLKQNIFTNIDGAVFA